MKKYVWTKVGLVLAVILLSFAVLFDQDYFEGFSQWVTGFEAFELDEFFFPIIILLVSFTLDLVLLNRKRRVESEKQMIYKAMVQASDHVLKNCLNQMLIVRYAAEESNDFDPEALKIYDEITEQAIKQLEALGKIEHLDRETIGKSIDIKIYQ